MKLEFLASGSPDCPLIRLYDFDMAAASRLREVFQRVSVGSPPSVPLHEEPGIEAIGGCRVDLSLGNRDRGILEIHPLSFECILTKEGWSNVAALTEPFCESEDVRGQYQWLNEDGEVSLLLSQNGSW
jgi:hypothetical protein